MFSLNNIFLAGGRHGMVRYGEITFSCPGVFSLSFQKKPATVWKQDLTPLSPSGANSVVTLQLSSQSPAPVWGFKSHADRFFDDLSF